MLKLFIAAIVGILVWQAIALVIYLATDENEKTTALFGMFVPWAVTAIVFSIVAGIRIVWKRNRFKAWLIDPAGNFCYCNSSKEPEWLGMIGYKFAHEIRKQYSFEDGWRKQDAAMGVINVRYSPIEKLKERGAYQVDKQTLLKAKKIYDEK